MKLAPLLVLPLLVLSGAFAALPSPLTPAHRTFAARLLVTIPDDNSPSGLAFDSEVAPYAGFSEVDAVNQGGNISEVAVAPSYYLNGSVAGYGYEELSNNSLPVGLGSDRIIYAPRVNTFYVLNNAESRVIAFKGPVYLSNGTALSPPNLVANITVGTGPVDECYDPFPGLGAIYVLNWISQSVGVINASSDRAMGNFTVPAMGPYTNVACDSWDGTFFLVTASGILARLNSSSDAIDDTVIAAGPTTWEAVTSLTFDSQNGLLYAVNSVERAVTVVNPQSLEIVANITMPATPWALAVDNVDGLVFVSAKNQTVVIDGYENQILSEFSIPLGPFAFAVDPVNKYLYASYETGIILAFGFSTGLAPGTETSTVTTTSSTTLTTPKVIAVTQTLTTSYTLPSKTITLTSTETSTAPSQLGGTSIAVMLAVAAALVAESLYVAYRRSGRKTAE